MQCLRVQRHTSNRSDRQNGETGKWGELQVKASRIRLAEVVAIKRPEAVPSTAGDAPTASDAVASTSLQNASNPSPSTSDPLAPSIEWQTAKCEQFEQNRNRIEAIFSNPEFRKKIPKKSWQPSKFIEVFIPFHWRKTSLSSIHLIVQCNVVGLGRVERNSA